MQPGKEQRRDAQQRGNLSQAQYEICRQAARKIASSNVQLMDVLSAKDPNKEGFVSNEDAVAAISEKRIPEVQASELQLICSYVDRSERGFVVIPTFTNKVTDLAQETP